MAKAKPAGKSAAKKSSKKKVGATKRKRKGKGGAVEDRPIIVKGHALPTDDELGDPPVEVKAKDEADVEHNPGTPFPWAYLFSDTTQPPIITIDLYVDGELVLEEKVEDKEWRVELHTV